MPVGWTVRYRAGAANISRCRRDQRLIRMSPRTTIKFGFWGAFDE